MAFKLPTPSNNKSENSSTSKKITSTISGRFVAVLPNEGVPQVFIEMTAKKISDLTYNLIVKLTYSTNEPVEGQKVEINFDEANTLAIFESKIPDDTEETEVTDETEETGETEETEAEKTVEFPKFISSKEGYTNNQGVYETTVKIDSADSHKTIIFVANSGTIQTSVAVSNT